MIEPITKKQDKAVDKKTFSPDEYHQIEDVIHFYKNFLKEDYKRVFSIRSFAEGLKEQNMLSCEMTSNTLGEIFNRMAESFEKDDDEVDELKDNTDLHSFIYMMIPGMRLSDELKFITPPFSMNIVYKTKKMQDIMDSDDYVMRLTDQSRSASEVENAIMKHKLILEKVYHIDFKNEEQKVLNIKNTKTGREKYYNFSFNYDFVDVVFNGDAPVLSDEELNQLYSEIDNIDLWRSKFPPSLTEFHGFCIASWTDITESEVISALRKEMYQQAVSDDFSDLKLKAQEYIRDYFGNNEVYLGMLSAEEPYQDVHPEANLSDKKESEVVQVATTSPERSGIYGMLTPERNLAVKDLVGDDLPELEADLVKKGFKSLYVYAIFVEGELKTMIEIASKEAFVIHKSSLPKLRRMSFLLEEIYLQMVDILDNQIRSIIQEKFTSVHPSISWKFREVANNYHLARQYNEEAEIDEIVFKDLLPIYGQADIVGSSTLRNQSIKQDLKKNLEEVIKVINEWQSSVNLHLLDGHRKRAEELLERISSKYSSKDENEVVHFITTTLHPYLHSIQERYNLPDENYKAYRSKLYAALGIIYDKRKDYENSVTKLNGEISRYVEGRDREMQNVLPHYFEMYKTDGVEYNIYLGQSILEEADFKEFDIKEFRLWQLKMMTEVVRLVKRIQPELAMPMTTAQLIFVYSHDLSIRFRMDEKRFDVDGTYNVRYEILKKRIDKATIMGTKDRLTVEDKIAIVYVDDKDKIEYLTYINYLISAGMIEEDFEDLELNPMQGVDGLKALRVTVKH